MERTRSVDWGRLSDKVTDPRLVKQLEYDIEVIDDSGIPELKRARKLFVGIHEDGNTLEFEEKRGSNPSLLVIHLRDIITAAPVTVQTKHMMTKRNKTLVQINLARGDAVSSGRSIRFDMNEWYISTLLDQINQFKDEVVNPSFVRAIAVARDSKLCIQCAKKKHELAGVCWIG